MDRTPQGAGCVTHGAAAAGSARGEREEGAARRGTRRKRPLCTVGRLAVVGAVVASASGEEVFGNKSFVAELPSGNLTKVRCRTVNNVGWTAGSAFTCNKNVWRWEKGCYNGSSSENAICQDQTLFQEHECAPIDAGFVPYGALDGEGAGNTDGVADYKFWCPIDQVYDRADVDRRKLWIYCECTQEAHVPTIELDQLKPQGNALSSEAFYDENVTIDTATVEDELEELWLSTFEDYPEEEFRNMLFEDLTEETSICLPYAANPNATADPFNGCLEWPSTPEGIQLAQRVNEVYAVTDRSTIVGWCPTKQFNGEFTMGGPCSLNYTAFEVAADYPGESVQPTQTPTFAPTASPTPSPSYAPTLTPVQKITLSPTLAPTSAPTQSTFDSWTGSLVVGFSNPESSATFNLTHSLRCHMKLVMSEDVQKTVFPGDNLDVAGDLKIKNLNRDLDGSELVPFTNLGKCVTLSSPIRGLSKFCLLDFVLVQNSQIRVTNGPTASPSRPPTNVQTKAPTVPVTIAPTKAPSLVSPTKEPTVVSSTTTPTNASPTVAPTFPTYMPTKAPTLGPVTASPTKQLVTLYQYLEALFVRKESPLYTTSLFLPTSSKERALQRKSPETVKLVFPEYLGVVAGDLGLDPNATAEEMFEKLFYRSRTRIPTRKNEPTDDATELVCFVESTTPSPEDISPPHVDGGVSDLGPESWEVIVGSILGFLCLVGFFCSAWCYSLRKPRLQDQSSQYAFGKSLDKDGPSEFRLLSSGKHSKSGSKWNLGPSQVAMDDIGAESMDDLQIELNNLTLGPVIGNGANGRIFKASYCGSDVAVKELFPRGGMNKRGFGKERTSSRLGNFRNYSSNATNTSTASSSINLDTLLQNHTLLGDRSSSTQHASSSSASVGTIYEADSTITELSVNLANKSMLPRRKSMPKHAISEETVHSLPNNGLGVAENLREGMQSFGTAPPSPIALSLDVGSADLPPPKLPPRPVQAMATSSRLAQRHSSASSLTSAHTDVDGLRHVDHALHEVLNEVKNLRLLRHPNIIQLFGCAKAKSNDTGGLRYLVVMELAACSLMDLILRTPKSQNLTFKDFPLERKLSVARQVAAGCAFIHENNLIHFDIKPENILLDAAGNAKICDLGIAKLSHGPDHSTESAQCGTPAYMAPELLGEVRNVTNKIDVYSYGLVLWQILHGRYCHPPTWSVPRLFFEVRNNHYRPPFDPLLRVDSALFDLVRKAWHDDPAERPEFHSIVRELDEIEADRGAGSVTQSLRRTAFSPGDEVGLWDYQQRQYMAAQVVSIDSEAQVATVELTGVTNKVVRTGVPIAEILPRQRIAGANLLHSVSGLARIHGGIRKGIRPASELALNEKAAVLPPVALMSLRFVDIAAPQSGHDTGQSSLSSTSLDVKNGSQYNMAKTFMFSDRVLEVKGFRLTEKGVESSTAIENGPVTRETGKDSKREGPGSLVPTLPCPSADVDVKPIKETLFKIGDLGRGVSGAVFAALHLPTFKLFAVKEVRFSDRGARHQAVRELNALYGQLSGESGSAQRCPNIVFLHHAYLDPDSTSVCLVMEYLDGGSLQDLLSRALAASIQPPAPSPPAGVQAGKAKFKMAFSSPVGFLERAETDHASHVGGAEESVFEGVEMASTGICYEPTLALIARSVLKAIAHLHARQMLHLDIKPANILINSRGEVKLADFGLSRQLEAAGEHFASTFVGTLKYMSPERLRGEVYSYPCDIFSFALTMLTVTLGRFPDELLSTTNTGDKESNATANLTGSSHGGLYPEDIPKHGSATYWQLHERWSSGKPLTLPERLIHKSPFKLNEGSTADTADKQFAGNETEVVNLSEEFRDFLEHGLRLDPSMRPTAEELLNHSWLTQVEDSVQSEFNNSFHQEAAMNLLQDVAFSLMSKARTDAQLREKIGPVIPGAEGAVVTVDERKVVTLADQLLLPVDVVKRTFVVASSENNATKDS